jgi:hypothetical protein
MLSEHIFSLTHTIKLAIVPQTARDKYGDSSLANYSVYPIDQTTRFRARVATGRAAPAASNVHEHPEVKCFNLERVGNNICDKVSKQIDKDKHNVRRQAG